MESQVYVIINSEAICENKILWDGVAEWTPPQDTLVVPESEVGMNLEIGQLVAQDIPLPEIEVVEATEEPVVEATEEPVVVEEPITKTLDDQ